MSKNWGKITFMTQNLNNIIILWFGTLPQTLTKSPGIITSYYYYLFLQWLLGTLSFPRMLHNTTSRVRDSNLFRKIIYIFFLIIALLNHRCTDDCPLLDYSFLVLNHGTVQQRKVACHCNELSHEI